MLLVVFAKAFSMSLWCGGIFGWSSVGALYLGRRIPSRYPRIPPRFAPCPSSNFFLPCIPIVHVCIAPVLGSLAAGDYSILIRFDHFRPLLGRWVVRSEVVGG